MSGKNKRWLLGLLVLLLGGYAVFHLGLTFWFRHHYRAAQNAIQRRDFRQARVHLERCLSVSPGNLDALLLAAQTARRRGEFEEAQRYLRLYTERNGPEDPADLEYVLLRFQRGNFQDEQHLLSLCEGRPDAPETALALEGVIEGLLNRHLPLYTPAVPAEFVVPPSATVELRRLIERWEEGNAEGAARAQGLVWRGRVSRLARDHASATADFRRALELDPLNFQARLLLAMETSVKSPEEAAEHLRTLYRQEPDNVRVRYVLAVVCRTLGRLDEATRLLDETLRLYPDDFSTLLERGNAAMDAVKPAEAETYLRRAVRLAPRESEPNFALSRCLRLQGKAEEAKHYQLVFEQLDAERERRSRPKDQ